MNTYEFILYYFAELHYFRKIKIADSIVEILDYKRTSRNFYHVNNY